jgi:hypothetical protein
MIFGDFDENDARCVWIAYPHLHQAPRLALGRPHDRYTESGEPLMLGCDIAHLHPQRQARCSRCPVCWLTPCAGNLQEAAAEEEHDRWVRRIAELPIDSKPQHVAIEASAASQIDRVQQGPAAQYVHAPRIARTPDPPIPRSPDPPMPDARCPDAPAGSGTGEEPLVIGLVSDAGRPAQMGQRLIRELALRS